MGDKPRKESKTVGTEFVRDGIGRSVLRKAPEAARGRPVSEPSPSPVATREDSSVSEPAVARKPGRPRGSAKTPWVAMGISSATYYRRRQRGEL